METRSSPSLHVLQGLARQAHIDAQDVSTLSKPALFVHLRSNYDYPRLERAHQVALKRCDGGDSSCCGNMDRGMGGSNKRPCRAGAGGSSSTASDDEQGLPPASIFVQTRSRTRMQQAAAGAGNSAAGGSVGQSRPGRVQGCANSTSPCRRPHNRKTSGRVRGASGAGSVSGSRGGGSNSGSSVSSGGGCSDGGGGSSSNGSNSSSSSGDSSGDSSSSGGNGGVNVDVSGSGGTSDSVNDGASVSEEARELQTTAVDRAPADAVCDTTAGDAETRKPDVGAEPNRTAENTARRKARRGRRVGTSSGRGSRKGKGKAKAKEHSGVPEGKGRGCEVRGEITPGAPGTVSVGSSNSNGVDKEGDRVPPNELDPIMLVKVGKDHHRFVRPNGRVVMYNLDSLVDYFISTGDFLEPETRLPFSDDELQIIDMKAKAAGLSKPSVLEAKRDPRRYTEQKFQQDALVGLERMTSELVTGMLRVVEGCDREEGEIRLVTELFPPFADLFKQIWGADKDFASQCMQHYISWLQGPPNRPTEDEMGFLEIIVGFLRQLLECDGNSSLGF